VVGLFGLPKGVITRMNTHASCLIIAGVLILGTALPLPGRAQNDVALEKITAHAVNRPLKSLSEAADAASLQMPAPRPPREILNYRSEGRANPGAGASPAAPDAVLQTTPGAGVTAEGSGFPGAANNDNGLLLGFLVAPPDTNGAVGKDRYVQMINLLTTVFDKNGNIIQGPFPSNAYWSGMGGNCGPNNQGDPVVLYDDTADRWLVSQFAFPDNLRSFSQCVAISQTGDPTGAYNRYEFSFDGYGLNDYPKHGIVNNSITMTANLFIPRGMQFFYAGTFLGVMDKAAMYAGAPTASLIGFGIGTGESGFVAGDLDGGGSAPALFATAMSQSNRFDIWQINVDWANQSNASASRIASIPITSFSSSLCNSSRGACIPQPGSGPKLESLSDRLMHRLQIRDFGAYRTMVAAHTINVGGGRAGIRWYELRQPSGGAWSLYQQGTYGPNDGEYRWMPSIAMNGAGDIGIGYLLANTSTFVSTAVAGQSAAATGSGQLDSDELICAPGSGVQTGTGRSGDYSATTVDPIDDTFWHTNEVFTSTGNFQWNTYVCEFAVGSGVGNSSPTAGFSYACNGLTCNFTDSSTDSDGSVTGWSWDFGDNTATSTAQNPSHTFPAGGGTFTVDLTVTDNDGATGSTSKDVTVVDPSVNNPPSASFTFACTGLDCNFTDTSTDDHGVTEWSWNFGDNATDSVQNPSHKYTADGTYTVDLTVTDGEYTDSMSHSVTVSSEILTASSSNQGKTWTATVTSNVSPLNGDFDGNPAACSGNTCTLSGIPKKQASVTFTSASGTSIVILKP